MKRGRGNITDMLHKLWRPGRQSCHFNLWINYLLYHWFKYSPSFNISSTLARTNNMHLWTPSRCTSPVHTTHITMAVITYLFKKKRGSWNDMHVNYTLIYLPKSKFCWFSWGFLSSLCLQPQSSWGVTHNLTSGKSLCLWTSNSFPACHMKIAITS